jgi:hypothetical protein
VVVGGTHCREAGSVSTFYQFDNRGATVQRLDSSGSVVSSHGWTAYGEALNGTADPYTGMGAQFGYYADGATGLQLLTNRYVNPPCGRGLSRPSPTRALE